MKENSINIVVTREDVEKRLAEHAAKVTLPLTAVESQRALTEVLACRKALDGDELQLLGVALRILHDRFRSRARTIIEAV